MAALLLRSVQENETADKYQEAFRQARIDCTSLSPISFAFIGLETLFSHVSHPEEFSGFIFSSPRTVQCVSLCLERHAAAGEWSGRLQGAWSQLPAFSVGTSTGGEVRRLGLTPMGEDSGNAEGLCRVILQEIKPGSKPLLYPCGTMRRETIPRTLKKEGIAFTEDVAYETVPSPELDQQFTKHLEDKGAPCCMVFFSPSGVQNAKDVLQKNKDALHNTKLLAIGGTTEVAMKEHGLTVAGVAQKPNPPSLLEAIQTCQQAEGR